MVFSHDSRVVVCTNCGATVDVPVGGGRVDCRECAASHQYPPFDPVAKRTDDGLDEGRRLAELRQQDGTVLEPPSHVFEGVDDDLRLDSLLPAFRKTVEEIRRGASFTAHEKLFFLALISAGRLWDGSDDLMLRAILQTAVEHVDSDRYRQALYSQLARAAIERGNHHAAEQWLGLLDPRSEDLLVDTCYRLASAEYATARNDFEEVLCCTSPGRLPGQSAP